MKSKVLANIFTGEKIKFTISSVISATVELIIFYFLKKIFSILVSTVISRIISATINFIINKIWSFKSKRKPGIEIIKFAVLFVAKMFASAGLVSLMALTKIPTMISKIIVDVGLFFINYIIQKHWIFKNEKNADKVFAPEENETLKTDNDL